MSQTPLITPEQAERFISEPGEFTITLSPEQQANWDALHKRQRQGGKRRGEPKRTLPLRWASVVLRSCVSSIKTTCCSLPLWLTLPSLVLVLRPSSATSTSRSGHKPSNKPRPPRLLTGSGAERRLPELPGRKPRSSRALCAAAEFRDLELDACFAHLADVLLVDAVIHNYEVEHV